MESIVYRQYLGASSVYLQPAGPWPMPDCTMDHDSWAFAAFGEVNSTKTLSAKGRARLVSRVVISSSQCERKLMHPRIDDSASRPKAARHHICHRLNSIAQLDDESFFINLAVLDVDVLRNDTDNTIEIMGPFEHGQQRRN